MGNGEGYCPCKDKAFEIAAKMLEADVVILASPVYAHDVSGSMKNFIDRMAYNCYRQSLAGKTAFAVTTSGVGSTPRAVKTMTTALELWGCCVAGTLRLRTGGSIISGELEAMHGKAVKAAARRIFGRLQPGEPRPSMRSLIVFKVQQMAWQKDKERSITREFWDERGWLDKRCTYYVPHRTSRILTAAARMTGAAVAVFFV